MTTSLRVFMVELVVMLLVGTMASVSSATAASQTQNPLASCLEHIYNNNSSVCYPINSSNGNNQNSQTTSYNYHRHYDYDYFYYPYYYQIYSNYPYNYQMYSNYPYNYGNSYYSTAYSPAPTTYELKVGTNPAGIGAVSGAGTYNQGAVATFSVTSPIVAKGTNEQYVFLSWSGDYSGSSPSGTVTMDSAKTIVANYQIQNLLDVSVDPQGIASAVGAGWYPADGSVTVGAVPPVVSGVEGTRYVFQGWTIDAAPASGNPVSVTMDQPHIAVAHYKTQYLLTASSEYGTIQGAGWYDAGSSATLSVTPQVDTGFGVRQVFDRWTGDFALSAPAGIVMMNSPHNLVAVWRTDSTVLYATLAVAIAGAFVLGIGLSAIAITRTRRGKTAKTT